MAAGVDAVRPPARAPDAILDACVLYPASVRGLLLSVAAEGAFRPAWSEPILHEVRSNLLSKHAMTAGGWQRLDGQLRLAFPDAIVPEPPIRAIEATMPNDPKDRHVLAAAVTSRAALVVTNNLRDFRAADVQSVGVRALHPDAYLQELLDASPGLVARGLSSQVQQMRRHGEWSVGQLLGHLNGLGRGQPQTPRFVKAAEQALGVRAVPPPGRSPAGRGPGRGRGLQPPALGR
jgi:predicted nucleic acid-binding protein